MGSGVGDATEDELKEIPGVLEGLSEDDATEDEGREDDDKLQSPNMEPRQVKLPVAPFLLPQRALVETLDEAGGEAMTAVEEARVLAWTVEEVCLLED
ncbi:hypothetical protein GQ44DRAFT_775913 [Phaeosphaeriaceae sp. PMI808]|nr:hypothetical protein GQ44DRAFT_775913 [Phaeosphaeriaceae sp. PMI808]